MEKIKINTEYIKLESLLKLAGLCMSGGEAKNVIGEGLVKVDSQVCTMRGKKLRGGERVEFDGHEITVENED